MKGKHESVNPKLLPGRILHGHTGNPRHIVLQCLLGALSPSDRTGSVGGHQYGESNHSYV